MLLATYLSYPWLLVATSIGIIVTVGSNKYWEYQLIGYRNPKTHSWIILTTNKMLKKENWHIQSSPFFLFID